MLSATDVRMVEAGQTLDYTDAKLGLKTPHGAIGICPACGRRGAIRLSPACRGGFKRDTFMIDHRVLHRGWCWEVEDHCLIAADDVAANERT